MGKQKYTISSYGLIKKIIKHKTYSVGTVMLCQINPTLYAVLVYDKDGNLTASCCNDVGRNKSVMKASLKNLNKVYKEVQDKMILKELVRN